MIYNKKKGQKKFNMFFENSIKFYQRIFAGKNSKKIKCKKLIFKKINHISVVFQNL